MSLKKLINNYVGFNLWANQRLVNWLSTKPDDLLYRELPSSFSSIIKTLNHIWGVEEYWYSIITETAEYENRFGTEDFVAAQIFEGLLRKSKHLKERVASYSEHDLMKPIISDDPDFQCELPRYEFLQHLINHGTYHRGQIITIGRNHGICDAPTTDYNVYHDPV
jgi:uncharacterized damage-inducible protein DinB